MTHSLLPTVYIVHRDLHPLCRPAHVTREPGATLIQMDWQSLRVEVAWWSLENLTAAERTVCRLAYNVDTDLSKPLDDDLLDGRVCDGPPVPPSLRLPFPVLAQQRSA